MTRAQHFKRRKTHWHVLVLQISDRNVITLHYRHRESSQARGTPATAQPSLHGIKTAAYRENRDHVVGSFPTA
jgi:hypothetical protein